MSARGHLPASFEGRSIQAPGMMRHGPVPSMGSASHRPMEPLPPPEILEKKVAVQGAEMDRLVRENQRLGATHGALRQELLVAQQEMQRIRAHVGMVQTESDAQIRVLKDKISKMEADIKVGESIKKELQQAHLEAQSLVGARQELSLQIQQGTEELHRTHSELKKLPEMHDELEGLMQDHQNLRAIFEREKGSNMELVQKMRAMENNLLTMAREVEKLRAEVQNAEKRVQAIQYQNTYSNVDSTYQNVGQLPTAYADGAYGQGVVYGNGGYAQVGGYATSNFVQGVSGAYTDPYGRTQHQAGSTAGDLYGRTQTQTSSTAADPYGRTQAQTSVTASDPYGWTQLQTSIPPDPYGRTQVQVSGTGEVANPYGVGSTSVALDASGVAANSNVAYDATRTTPSTAVAYDAARTSFGSFPPYDPSRAGMVTVGSYDTANNVASYDTANNVASYDPARAGATPGATPGAYDAARAQSSMQSTLIWQYASISPTEEIWGREKQKLGCNVVPTLPILPLPSSYLRSIDSFTWRRLCKTQRNSS